MSNYCSWHKVRYETPECSKCALATWSDQKKGGFIVIFFLWPLWSAGAFLGALFSALACGFKAGSGLWADSVKWIGAPKPGRREES